VKSQTTELTEIKYEMKTSGSELLNFSREQHEPRRPKNA
jgi:hypothetical protein